MRLIASACDPEGDVDHVHGNYLRQGLRDPLGRALVGFEDVKTYRAQGRVVTENDRLAIFDSCWGIVSNDRFVDIIDDRNIP
jgi:hypothetical protein